MSRFGLLFVFLVMGASAQEAPGISERWHFFSDETFSPLTLLGGAFYAGLSQISQSQPGYGEGSGAYAERLGASTADVVGQNFFVDFVMASAFHEDTRYVRLGSGSGFFSRVGHAVSSGFVTRTNSGARTFNWANLTGTAAGTGLSMLYYPPDGRRPGPMAIRFGTNVATTGLVALFPEFWPDFHAMLVRHHLFPHRL